jgi:hypothetical protein
VLFAGAGARLTKIQYTREIKSGQISQEARDSGHPVKKTGGDGATSPTDGKTAVTGSRGKTARLWKIPQPIRGDPERIFLWAQVITGLELDEHGVVRFLDADTWHQRRQRLQELGGPPEM